MLYQKFHCVCICQNFFLKKILDSLDLAKWDIDCSGAKYKIFHLEPKHRTEHNLMAE